jgi:phytoene synthase
MMIDFVELMRFETERALRFYAMARANLPPTERGSLVAAEIMQRVYRGILERMQADDYQVFTKRYRLTRLEKIAVVLRVVVASKLKMASR